MDAQRRVSWDVLTLWHANLLLSLLQLRDIRDFIMYGYSILLTNIAIKQRSSVLLDRQPDDTCFPPVLAQELVRHTAVQQRRLVDREP